MNNFFLENVSDNVRYFFSGYGFLANLWIQCNYKKKNTKLGVFEEMFSNFSKESILIWN